MLRYRVPWWLGLPCRHAGTGMDPGGIAGMALEPPDLVMLKPRKAPSQGHPPAMALIMGLIKALAL